MLRARGRPARLDGSAATAPGWPSAASSRNHRGPRRRAPRARRSPAGPAAARRWRCVPSASVARTSASAYRVKGARLVCHGGAGSRCRAWATWATSAWAASASPVSSVTAASVPAAPPIWTGKRRARRSSRASSTPWSHCAALSPKVMGTACWVSVRPAIRWSRCRSARSDERRHLTVEVGEDQPVRGTGAEHQRGVEHVLAGEPAVQPSGGRPRRVRRVARASAPRAVRRGCHSPRPSRRSRRGPALLTSPCSTSASTSGARPARWRAWNQTFSTSTIVSRKAPWSKAIAARSSPGQKRSAITPPGTARKTVSPSPWSRTSKRKPSSSGVATRVRPPVLGE